MSEVTIYHNPKCGTSRNTLEMIRNAGIEPNVILYLETPPTRETLVKLIADMGITVRNFGCYRHADVLPDSRAFNA